MIFLLLLAEHSEIRQSSRKLSTIYAKYNHRYHEGIVQTHVATDPTIFHKQA